MGASLAFAPPCPKNLEPQDFEGELLWVPRTEWQPVQLGVPCLLLQQLKPPATQLLLVFHANAEDLARLHSFLRSARDALAVHVLAVEYPGYGFCSGVPSEEAVRRDAETVLQFVESDLQVPLDRVIVMGRSIGCVPAIFLASQHKCGGLVTLGAFSSLSAVLGPLRGFARLFLEAFDNRKHIGKVRCPTLIVHGAEDSLVDAKQAEELAELCGADVAEGERPAVTLSLREGVEHNINSVEEDLVEPFLEAFPSRQGWVHPLMLTAAEWWLRRQPLRLAADVAARMQHQTRKLDDDDGLAGPSPTPVLGLMALQHADQQPRGRLVRLVRQPGADLGFEYREGGSPREPVLVVHKIDDEGLLTKLNAGLPEMMRVLPDSAIVAVNSVTGSSVYGIALMEAELSKQVVELEVVAPGHYIRGW